MDSIKKNELVAFFIGILIGGIATHLVLPLALQQTTVEHTHTEDEYHVHADFLIYIEDEKVNLSQTEYMTTSERELHDDAHLHDENGEVAHLHASDTTFVAFLGSLGVQLTEDCLTIDETAHCATPEKDLTLYVNYESYDGEFNDYIPQDDDAVLVYYGVYDPETITNYMNEVKDDACYYSGTCPERGVAPPESCGLTCEL